MENKSVAVRFVLSGACHPYSGRQVLFNVELKNGLTVRQLISDFVAPNWPSELPELGERVSPTSVKLLKAGRAVDMDREVASLLTSEEIACAAARDADLRIESAVLFHIVFIPQDQRPPDHSPVRAPVAHASDGNAARRHTQNEVKATGECCVVM